MNLNHIFDMMTSRDSINLILDSAAKDESVKRPMGYFDIFSELALEKWRKEGLPVDIIPEEYFGIDIILFSFKYIARFGFPDISVGNIEKSDFNYVLKSKVYERALSKGKYVCIAVPGPFQHIVSLYGYNEVFQKFVSKRGWIKKQFEKSIKYILRMLFLIDKKGFRFDGVWIWEDIAGDDGLFFSLYQYEDLLQYFHSELIDCIFSLGKKVFFHSDGNLKSVLPILADIGINVIHPLESKIYNLKELKKEFPKLVFMGGINYREFFKKEYNVLDKDIFKNNYIYSADSTIMEDISFLEYKKISNLIKGKNYGYKN